MIANVTAYHKPETMSEAVRLIRRRSVKTVPLAGGAGLLAHPDPTVQAVVDLSGLGLDYIRSGKDSIEIGAMTTLQSLVESPLVSDYCAGLLTTAAHDAATRTMRNAATVGGSIAACTSANDLVVALLALDAVVVMASGEVRPLADVLAHKRSADIIVEARLPRALAAYGAGFCRVARLPSDQAIVNVAALVSVKGGVCVDIRLAAGGVAPKPLRLAAAEALLRGARLDDASLEKAAVVAMKAVHPRSDILGSSEYRRAMLGVLVQRAVRRCQGGEA